MTTDTRINRHPVRGALFGFMLGISAAYFLYFQFAVFGFDTVGAVITRFVIIILVGVVVGVVWAYIAPPRRAKELAPPASVMAPEAPPAFAPEPSPAFAPEPPPVFEPEPEPEPAPLVEEVTETVEAEEPENVWKPDGAEDEAGEPEEA